MDISEFCKHLRLEELVFERPFHIEPTSALTDPRAVVAGAKWLAAEIKVGAS